MQDHVGAAQRVLDCGSVGDVADDELRLFGKIGGTLAVASVDLRREIVEQADFIAGRQQHVGRMRSDESGASSDQYSRHSPLRAAVRPILRDQSVMRMKARAAVLVGATGAPVTFGSRSDARNVRSCETYKQTFL
ncbi:hypothetical protein ACVWZZ_000546 [Bradyrhizobium sp. LM6.10]